MIDPSTIPSQSVTQRTVAAYQPYDRPFARISWGSVFAGAVIALATQVVLALIGMAIGLATLNPTTGDSPSGTALGAGAAIWLVVSSLVALFFGGYIAARLAGRFNGWLHGLITWGTLTLLTLGLLTTAAGQLIGAASGLTNFVVNNSNRTYQLPPALQQQVDRLKTQADQSAAQAQSTDPQTRDAQARDAGEKAAKGGAVGTGAAAFGMILGAVAAALGGRAGERSPRRDVYDVADNQPGSEHIER